jgi:hypothetical protein
VPSLLVTKKMSPELAARVQASVQGRRAAPGARLAPRAISLLRLGLTVTILLAGTWLVWSFRQMRQETESKRTALLERVRRESADLGADELRTSARILPWLALASGSYEGDLVADELSVRDQFRAILARPSVYVRGPVASFRDEARVVQSATGSFKDAFVLCLVEPPKDRSESVLRKKALAAYSASDGMKSTVHVERLADALVGLPYLGKDWRERIAHAASREDLDELGNKLEHAPLEAAKRAARARYLLFAMDEPGDKPGPSELDGERPHEVRVGLVDLAAKKVLLRLRRRVDPSFLSPASRAELANGIDGCALALDVQETVTSEHEVAAGR